MQDDSEEAKPLIPFIVANNNDILNFIADFDIEVVNIEGEEIEMTVGPNGFAKPINTMLDGRIKRENDELSGAEPYFETVS